MAETILTGTKIVMAGCHELGYNLLRLLLENQIIINYIVTIDQETAIKEKVSGYVDLREIADKFDIPIYVAQKYSLKTTKDISFFTENKFDLLIQGGWQRLFPEILLNTLSIGAVGVHGSSEFLPKGRGRSPINWSLIEGRERFILHYFLMKPGVDDGEIFHYEMFDINVWDDCRTLYYKNTLLTSQVLLKFIPKLMSGDVEFYPQEGVVTYYPKRTEEDGRIDWMKSVLEIYNLVRGVTKPYPGAFCYSINGKVRIWKAQPFDTRIDHIQYQYGQIIDVFNTGHFIIKCSGGLLLVTEFEGKINNHEILY